MDPRDYSPLPPHVISRIYFQVGFRSTLDNQDPPAHFLSQIFGVSVLPIFALLSTRPLEFLIRPAAAVQLKRSKFTCFTNRQILLI